MASYPTKVQTYETYQYYQLYLGIFSEPILCKDCQISIYKQACKILKRVLQVSFLVKKYRRLINDNTVIYSEEENMVLK